MPAAEKREIPLGRSSSGHQRYPSNRVVTSKYTVATFVPKNLWEQFHKAANVWFLFISFLMFLGTETPLFVGTIKFYSTFGVLAAMMAVSAFIAATDDYRRHMADNMTNSQTAYVLRQGDGRNSEDTTWASVEVGDILIVKGDQDFPADMLLLASSGDEGICYVSTANLDGETNLKIKSCLPATVKALCQQDHAETAPQEALLNQAVRRLPTLQGTILAEAPQKSIHTFNGQCKLNGSKGSETYALGPDQLLLRGTVLRNTAWCIGIVVYTGHETRMAMNSREAPLKQANLERVINLAILVFVAAQAFLSLISDIIYCALKDEFLGFWYLFPTGETTPIVLPPFLGYWLTFFVLYSNLIPISLYATLECCNWFQAYFIKSDEQMYDEEQDCPASARTTNLGHELGQISYIFSDKTGTLTQNVMELKRVSIAGVLFGQAGGGRGFQGGGAMQEQRQRAGKSFQDAADAFLEVLSVSHTVMTSRDASGKISYEAESPDEGALVEAVAELGWAFSSRSRGFLQVSTPSGVRTYQVLALNAFTSARKRMSTVIQRPNGEHVLLVKGADNVMMERAGPSNDLAGLQQHLTLFAREGLRTLVLGRRNLTGQEFTAWQQQYEQAQASMTDREKMLADAAESIERDLDLLGITAIEDKLQEGVQDTIVQVRKAGIKLWVLTGDKLETAQNIGFSTKVLSEDMDINILDVQDRGTLEDNLYNLNARVKKALAHGIVPALLVTGLALEEITAAELKDEFLAMATRCSVVIACRVSPSQKAEMVQLVRDGIEPTPVTLAIGDGANDVPMIQEAQVGVGISGREGRQAVNSADFAIAQFRYLSRLLLVHGRWNYSRTCKFTLYSFWKNATLVLLMFFYVNLSGYAGTSFFDDNVRACYNVVLATPIVATGIFDKDVSDEAALHNPTLYENGRRGLEMNAQRMLETLASSILQSSVLALLMYLAFPSFDSVGIGDYYSFGTAWFVILVIAMNLRAVYVTTTWNWCVVFCHFASYTALLVLLVVYGMVQLISDLLEPWMYRVPAAFASTWIFWICCLVVPLLVFVLDVCKAYLIQQFMPDRRVLLRESFPDEEETPFPLPLLSESATVATLGSGPPSLTSGRSSYAFDHPDAGIARHHTTLRDNPLHRAGDTTYVATHYPMPRMGSRDFASSSSFAESDSESWSAEESRRPNPNNFSQQKLAYVQLRFTWRVVFSLAVVGGTVLLVLGSIVYVCSNSVREIRIDYNAEGDSWQEEPNSRLLVKYNCQVGAPGSTTKCRFSIDVPMDMEPPIMVSYSLDPFYQNYPEFMDSISKSKGAWKQLTGNEEPGGSGCGPDLVERFKQGDETVRLFPCGLAANSLFNDTLEFLGDDAPELDTSGIAWRSDLDRFSNPPKYLEDPDFSWLPDRYPTVIDRDEGVRSERFAVWMRPEAMPRVWKTYGVLHRGLSAGQQLQLRINASYPVKELGATKEFVFTTVSPLGGRSEGFGTLLLVWGGVCWLLGVVVLATHFLCARRRGEARDYACLPVTLAQAGREGDSSYEEADHETSTHSSDG